MDVLELQRISRAVVGVPEGFGDIERYVARLLQKEAASQRVAIVSPESRGVLYLHCRPFRLGCCPAGLSVTICNDNALEEQAVRRIFEEAGIPPFPAFWSRMIGPVYPLPGVTAEAAGLIGDVLERGFGLRRGSRLGFCYWR